jgi:hypothetical protein
MHFDFKEAPLAPEGYTKENYYALLPPFWPRGKLAKGAPPIFSRTPTHGRSASERATGGARCLAPPAPR